jgi:hypothetical protein
VQCLLHPDVQVVAKCGVLTMKVHSNCLMPARSTPSLGLRSSCTLHCKTSSCIHCCIIDFKLRLLIVDFYRVKNIRIFMISPVLNTIIPNVRKEFRKLWLRPLKERFKCYNQLLDASPITTHLAQVNNKKSKILHDSPKHHTLPTRCPTNSKYTNYDYSKCHNSSRKE